MADRPTSDNLGARKWMVLVALAFALFGLQMCLISPGGCALPLMERYGIDPTLFSMVMSVPYFCGVLFGLFSGALADRIGVRKVFIAGYSLAFVGAIWRALSGESYLALFLSNFVMGFATAALNANSAKIIQAWFTGRFASVAFGIYVAGASLGAAAGLQLGARFDVQVCWNVGIGVIAAIMVVWFVLYRDHPDGIAVDIPLSRHLGIVARNRGVWGISLYAFVFLGCTPIATTFLVPGMQVVNGFEAATAANISTIGTLLICVSCIVSPALISRLPYLRGVTIALLLVSGVLYAAAFVVGSPSALVTGALLAVGGLAVGGPMATAKSMPALLPGIDPQYLGAVGGFHSMFQNLGMFLVSSYIVSPICLALDPAAGPAYYTSLFVAFLVCCLVACAVLFLFPNLRTAIDRKVADEQAPEAQR